MNVTNLQDLPKIALEDIFSFLPARDLASVAKTCRACNAAQKAEWLWKNRCHLDLRYDAKNWDSWKEQYVQISKNLTSGSSALTAVCQDMRFLNYPFTVLDDGAALMVCQDQTDSSSVSVRSLKSDSVIAIDMRAHGRALGSCFHGSLWTVLTETGEIASFNLLTGACEQRISCKDIDLRPWISGLDSALLSRTEREIALWAGDRVCIWDAQSGVLVQELRPESWPEHATVYSICITPNFVVCGTKEAPFFQGEVIRAIKRADSSVVEIDRASVCRITSSDTHVAYVTSLGEVRVLADKSETGLEPTQRFACRPDQNPLLSLGKKCLCVIAGEEFLLFDLYTGERMCESQGYGGTSAVYKEHVVFSIGHSHGITYSLIHDFGRNVALIQRTWS